MGSRVNYPIKKNICYHFLARLALFCYLVGGSAVMRGPGGLRLMMVGRGIAIAVISAVDCHLRVPSAREGLG